jgi:hypothetical protein
MNCIITIITSLVKVFDLSKYNIFGIYHDGEIITMRKRIHFEYYPKYTDLVYISRHDNHYDLYFLLSFDKYRIDLHFPSPGHHIELLNEKGEVIENPYEEGTPFRLQSHKLRVNKRVRRGISMGNHCVHEGDHWPIDSSR